MTERVSPEEMARRKELGNSLDDHCAWLVSIVQRNTSPRFPFAIAVADEEGFVVAFGGNSKLAATLRASLTEYLRTQGQEMELWETAPGLIPEKRPASVPEERVRHPYPSGEPIGGG